MAFPAYKRRLLIGKKPDGWENLGPVEDHRRIVDGEGILTWETHKACATRLHMGKQDGQLFQFCPRCLTQVRPLKKTPVEPCVYLGSRLLAAGVDYKIESGNIVISESARELSFRLRKHKVMKRLPCSKNR